MAAAKRKSTRKPKRNTVRARTTSPDKNVGSSGSGWEEARVEAAYWQLGLLDKYKENISVNEETALTFSAVWACVRYISQTIAGLGWHVFEGDPSKPGKERIFDDTSWLLDTQASPEMDAFNFRQVMLKDALTWGNGYAEIDRDGMGRPKWLWYLPPHRVSLERTSGGQLYYEIDNGVGMEPSRLLPERMFHLKGLGPDGLVGYSVIAMARATIQLGLQQQKFGNTFFSRGPMPGGTLEIPGNPKAEERDRTRKSFEEAYGGAKNAGRVIALSGGMKFNPLSLPNKDAEWLDGRKFSVTEIARWYGVPPHKIADLDKATFSNIESQAIEAVQDCHLPWCRRLETEADIKLFGRVMRGRRWTRLNLNTLLRGDSATQTANMVSQVNTGLRTPDEAREMLDLNPLPDGLGEKPIVQGAMKPLEMALEPPDPPQPAAAPQQDNPDPQQAADNSTQNRTLSQQVRDTFGAMLATEYSRWLNVESDKARRAENKGETNQQAALYTMDGTRLRAESLRQILAGLMLAIGRPTEDAAEWAERLAADHRDRSLKQLADKSWRHEWSNGRAEVQALEHLEMVQ